MEEAREYTVVKFIPRNLMDERCVLLNMRYQVYIYQDEDGRFVAECPIIPGCVSGGDTYDEAIAMIKDAIRGCLEVRKELGMPPIVAVEAVEVTV